MNEYVAGWDGGGSKTAMQLRDKKGTVLQIAEAGPLNYNSQNTEAMRQTIEDLLAVMKKTEGGLSACKCLCIATAGISNPKAVLTITELVRRAGYENQLHMMGDHEAALYGALGKAEGIVLISGTGSICYGKNKQGQTKRTGGYGHLIDDEGSGYAIGRDILASAVRCLDGRIKNSRLCQLVLNEIGGTGAEDIIAFTYRQDFKKTDIASLAKLLLPALNEQDQQAQLICDKAAGELVKLVEPVIEELHMECGEAAFLGGILTHFQPVLEKTKSMLLCRHPGLILSKPLYDSVTGAALSAWEQIP